MRNTDNETEAVPTEDTSVVYSEDTIRVVMKGTPYENPANRNLTSDAFREAMLEAKRWYDIKREEYEAYLAVQTAEYNALMSKTAKKQPWYKKLMFWRN